MRRRSLPVSTGFRGRPVFRCGVAKRRGSTFIVVLAILSLLVLIATALSLTSRLEVISAANYAEGIQSRMAAKTGLAIASIRTPIPLSSQPLETRSVATASVSSASARPGLTPAAAATQPALANGGVVDFRALATIQNVSLAEVRTYDASARININTADANTLARLFQTVSQTNRISSGNPVTLARAIVAQRRADNANAPTDIRQYIEKVSQEQWTRELTSGKTSLQPGSVAGDVATPDLRQADLRVPPLQGEQRFSSLADLLSLPGASPALIGAAAPYLTVFSSSKVLANTSSGSQPLVDLNTASVQQVYEALQTVYGSSGKSQRLLEQFAVNVVDWRDPDRVPTVFPGTAGVDPVLGVERTPFLTEVWPNSIFPEETNGAGQYVEIYNPWSDPMDVTGWNLSIGGAKIPLNGWIAPAGYLIVTDIYNGLDSTKKVNSPFDSFYSIFGAVSNGSTHRILENPELMIPWNEGIHQVQLRDDSGQLIDVFTYTIKTPLRGQKTSFQRVDPRIRVAALGACTPFAFPHDVTPFAEATDPGQNRYPGDRPFLSATEVMKVFDGWGSALTGEQHAGFPVLAVPGSPDPAWSQKASDSTSLNARLLDLFTVRDSSLWKLAQGATPESLQSSKTSSAPTPSLSLPGSTTVKGEARVQAALDRLVQALPSTDQRQAVEKAVDENDHATLAALAARAFLPLDPNTRLGCVNLNTAPQPVLASLPGLSPSIASAWVKERETLQARARLAQPIILFNRPSDLLLDPAFWNADSTVDQRFRRLTSLLPLATFTTSSVFMDSRTLVQEPAPSQSRQPAISRALALVAFDRDKIEFVAWSQTP